MLVISITGGAVNIWVDFNCPFILGPKVGLHIICESAVCVCVCVCTCVRACLRAMHACMHAFVRVHVHAFVSLPTMKSNMKTTWMQFAVY